SKPWLTGILKRIPYLGLLSLLTATLCAVATLAILVSSNSKDIKAWPSKAHPLQPTVIVAILSAVANSTLRYALAESLTLFWWNKALSGDSSLKDLHLSWAYASSFQRSLFSGRRFNTIALACIITTLVTFDGPLLQRSSSVATRSIVQDMTFDAPVTFDPLPRGYSGQKSLRGSNVTSLSLPFARVAKEFQARDDMHLDIKGCKGVCKTDIHATGLDVQCSQGTAPYNITLDREAWGTEVDIGGISFSREDSDAGAFNATVRYKNEAVCTGLLQTIHCTFRLATVSYPITIANGTVSLRPAGLNDTVAVLPPFAEFHGISDQLTTLGGVVLLADQLYKSEIAMLITVPIFSLKSNGSMSFTHLNSTDGCNVTYLNPMPDIQSGLRELMFRTALSLSNSSFTQAVPGTDEFNLNVYNTNYYYLVAGLCLIVANALAILPLFLGWWHLGRAFSMSPLEIAKAFGSPLLAKAGSNKEADDMVRGLDDTKVQYGAVA
ncbi:uncharacterized protein K452DRAFT_215651, partial [Aplosporella prunicola CBS 121167]